MKNHSNNFNLLRMLLAIFVLVAHSFALTASENPITKLLGFDIGQLAVDCFFVISGFLVTQSLTHRISLTSFLKARCLRIYPALWAMVFFTVFFLGVFFTTLSIGDYLAHHRTHVYFVKCSTLVSNVVYDLPGVFKSNPYKGSVNGSLWSLPYEIKMYFILGAAWLLCSVTPTFRLKTFTSIVILFVVTLIIFSLYVQLSVGGRSLFGELSIKFFAGALFFLTREKIIYSGKIFFVLIGILILAIPYKVPSIFLYWIALPYCLLYLAFFKSRFLGCYNKVGDYSYGTYIYAFPIQQSIVAIEPTISPYNMLLWSALITLIFAITSWHHIEKPLLKFKSV